MEEEVKPLVWVGSAYKDLVRLPGAVQDNIGYALYLAQTGQKHRQAKPLSGFGGAGVLEIVEDFDGDAYRAAYTVRFAENVYVLHVFQKKSRQGISTPPGDIKLIRSRLQQAQEMHQAKQEKEK